MYPRSEKRLIDGKPYLKGNPNRGLNCHGSYWETWDQSKYTHSSCSLNLSSCLLKINVWRSRKVELEWCRCVAVSLCDVINQAGMWGGSIKYVTSQPFSDLRLEREEHAAANIYICCTFSGRLKKLVYRIYSVDEIKEFQRHQRGLRRHQLTHTQPPPQK